MKVKTWMKRRKLGQKKRTVVFTTRCRPDTRAMLEDAAIKSGRSLSDEIATRLEASLRADGIIK